MFVMVKVPAFPAKVKLFNPLLATTEFAPYPFNDTEVMELAADVLPEFKSVIETVPGLTGPTAVTPVTPAVVT